MNTYGIRLLMPFDERWFYGDTLFIIDPWIWLVLAAGVLLARQRNYTELAFWFALGVLSSWLMFNTEHANIWIQSTWFGGLALIVILRIKRSANNSAPSYARVSIAMVVVYVCALYGVARITENLVTEQFEVALQVQANPLPGQPFSHRVILVYDEYYRSRNPYAASSTGCVSPTGMSKKQRKAGASGSGTCVIRGRAHVALQLVSPRLMCLI